MTETALPSADVYQDPLLEQSEVGDAAHPKQERTLGLKLVDTFIYPVVNNLGVFAISVGFTFLTKHGVEVGDHFQHVRESTNNPVIASLSYGAEHFSRFWAWRGKQTVDFLEPHMGRESAEMAKMVTFSFLDGCLLAPAVKLLEDRRGDLAKGIDTFFHTKPIDESIYDAEPKQTWGSVLGGRALTAAMVVPTAVIMDNLYLKNGNGNEFVNFNTKFLNNVGLSLANDFQTYFPDMAEKIGIEVKDNLGESRLETLGKTAVFEAFYTSVCTAGLYASSRMIAKHGEEKAQEKEQKQALETQIRTPYTVVKKTGEKAEYAPTWGGKLQPSTAHALAT